MKKDLTEEIQATLDSIAWEKITTDNLWKPEIKGEMLVGKYLRKKIKADSNGRTRYTFTAPDGDEISVFSTKILDPAMQKIPIGSVVKITFTGEKATGQYNALKLFDVEMAPEGTEIEPMIIIPPQSNTGGNGPGLANSDDPEAVNMIEHYIELIKDTKGKNHNPTAWEVINLAEAEELTPDDTARLKLQLADMVQHNKIREGEGEGDK
jgi:hypothetical protein